MNGLGSGGSWGLALGDWARRVRDRRQEKKERTGNHRLMTARLETLANWVGLCVQWLCLLFQMVHGLGLFSCHIIHTI